jgi:hypothetical protein
MVDTNNFRSQPALIIDSKMRAVSDEDNIMSNLGSANKHPMDHINQTQGLVGYQDEFQTTQLYLTNKENSAIDLVGLGG